MKSNKLIVFSGPSGTGKTTLVKYVLNKFSKIQFQFSNLRNIFMRARIKTSVFLIFFIYTFLVLE